MTPILQVRKLSCTKESVAFPRFVVIRWWRKNLNPELLKFRGCRTGLKEKAKLIKLSAELPWFGSGCVGLEESSPLRLLGSLQSPWGNLPAPESRIKHWKQLKCPSRSEWITIHGLWDSHTVEYLLLGDKEKWIVDAYNNWWISK